jgi:Tfp pilus assembly protein PilE
VIATSFVERWIWPAGGSGGIPGDVVATLIWVIIVGIATTIVYPPFRKALERFVKGRFEAETAELHAKLDHIIEHHPDIPPYVSKKDQPST